MSQLEEDFGIAPPLFGIVFHNHGRNMNSLLQMGDQALVETMGFSGLLGVEEGQAMSFANNLWR